MHRKGKNLDFLVSLKKYFLEEKYKDNNALMKS